MVTFFQEVYRDNITSYVVLKCFAKISDKSKLGIYNYNREVIMRYLYVIIIILVPVFQSAQELAVDEDFASLNNWRSLKFDRIETLSLYSIKTEGESTYLKTSSNGGASGLIFKKRFNIYNYPKIEFRWRADSVLASGNALKKSGDDYPIRVYILFEYDPERATTWEKIRFEAVKLIYGEYPPHSSINYIWANRNHGKIGTPKPLY
jgi:hypothetical protein